MTTVLLLRHGRTVANRDGLLAGWLPDVHLDDVGIDQAEDAARRLSEVRYSALITSPMERCRETADYVAERRRKDLPTHTEVDLAECRYGDWTGRSLDVLAKEPLWEQIQTHPSSVHFPEGESLGEMQSRAIRAIRKWNRRLGPNATYIAVTHGDVIKSILADALGMHLDLFQRIVVDPGSVSVIQYGTKRATVARLNDTGGNLGKFSPKRSRRETYREDGVVGGGKG